MADTRPRDNPLHWFSRRLHRALDRPPIVLTTQALLSVDAVLDGAAELQRVHRLYRLAENRQWRLAARQLAALIPILIPRLRESVSSAVAGLTRDDQRLQPSVWDLHQELVALEEEFDALHLDRRRQVIGVTTERIELEGVNLGPFRIELRLDGLKDDRHIVGAFSCVATDPNPPTCSQSTTHPHVRDNQPCLGEATAAVSGALREGRLLDAFLAVASVLRTYNPGSPYVALADWDGESCSDCGGSCSDDDLYSCESCNARCCEGCSSSCDVCHGSYCIGCLERDGDDQNLCAGCRGHCADCNTITEQSVLEEHGGRCRDCAEQEDDGADTEVADVTDIDEGVVTVAVLELKPSSDTEPAPPPLPASAEAPSAPTDHPNLEPEYA